MSLSVLQSIEDVTAKVNAGVTAGMAAADSDGRPAEGHPRRSRAKRRPASRSRWCRSTPGAVYNLYTYKVYTDVRLVFGVEYQTGFFGGDPDNFTYPRYCLDVSMFRLYENDKPAQDAELPQVVAGRHEGRRAGLHDGPPRARRSG